MSGIGAREQHSRRGGATVSEVVGLKASGRRAIAEAFARSPVRVHAQPDFLILGAQKAGTSSLFSWLKQHPDVLAPTRKELHCFDQHWQLGAMPERYLRPYWAQFPLRAQMGLHRARVGRRAVTGEATPSYLFHPQVPGRVAEALPDVKLIVILRDPVERALSHYWHERNRGTEDRDLRTALDEEAETMRHEFDRLDRGDPPTQRLLTASYVSRGRYAEQLDRWLRHFDRAQLLILRFDDLVADPRGVLGDVTEFLGIAPADGTLDYGARNTGSRRPPESDVAERLRCDFRVSNEQLARRYRIEFDLT